MNIEWRKRMPSLDGYSLNEEIQKIRKEVFEELAKTREAFGINTWQD